MIPPRFMPPWPLRRLVPLGGIENVTKVLVTPAGFVASEPLIAVEWAGSRCLAMMAKTAENVGKGS